METRSLPTLLTEGSADDVFRIIWSGDIRGFYCVHVSLAYRFGLGCRNIPGQSVDLRKFAHRVTFELRFIWGLNEDGIPGESPSENSEKLLQRGDGQCTGDPGEGGVLANISLCRESLVGHRGLMSSPHEAIRCFSRYGKMQALAL